MKNQSNAGAESFYKSRLVRIFLDGQLQRGMLFGLVFSFPLETWGDSVVFLPIAGMLFLRYAAHKWWLTRFLARRISKPKVNETVRYLYRTAWGDRCDTYLKDPVTKHCLRDFVEIRPGVKYSMKARIINIGETGIELDLLPQSRSFETDRIGLFADTFPGKNSIYYPYLKGVLPKLFPTSIGYADGTLIRGNPGTIMAAPGEILIGGW